MLDQDPNKLPRSLRPLFWDCAFEKLSWRTQRDFIAGRILQEGAWGDICWLRERMTPREMRAWLVKHKGRGLSTRRLRYWQAMLGMPKRRVDAWLAGEARRIWEHRART